MTKKRTPLAIELGITNVLEIVRDVYGINGEVHHDEYQFHCLVHADSDPSCDVNLVTGDWNCFSCKAKGDLATLGTHALKKKRFEILELLIPSSPEARLSTVQGKIARLRSESVSERNTGPSASNLHDPSEYERGPLTYLRDRGFTKRTCLRYGVRYVREAQLTRKDGNETKMFTITYSIAIPVRDEQSRLLGWCYRRTDDSAKWQPRYLYTPELQLARRWFGLNRIELSETAIAICEGALDCMWLMQSGIPALALLGSQISPEKAAVLQRFRRVVMFPDYDHGGYDSTYMLGSLLRGRTPVSVCRYPRSAVKRMEDEGKDKIDPQDLHPQTLRKMAQRAIPWQLWMQQTERRQVDSSGN